jgi:hypothetical protein
MTRLTMGSGSGSGSSGYSISLSDFHLILTETALGRLFYCQEEILIGGLLIVLTFLESGLLVGAGGGKRD